VDWNNDGKKDLLTGEYDGFIRVYLNTNTDSDPQFNGYFRLQNAFSDFDAGSYSCPYVTDWNEDGLFDVLCGESGGKVWLLVNQGTPGNPSFPTTAYVQSGSAALDVGGVSCPTTVDWNRDGKKDLVIGETYGEVFYCENTGSNAAPEFNGFTKLKAGFGYIDTGYYSRPYPADWNDDGVMDIVCGDYNGKVLYYEAIGPLALKSNTLPEGSGGTINMELRAGTANGDRNYVILGSLSGTEPGSPLPGGYVTLPLNWDAFTDLGLSLVNSPVFTGFMGKLDGNGNTLAQLNAPPLPGFAGVVMYFAFTLNNPFDFVSNAAAIEITP
jgi:hypothetical protein